MFDRNLQQFFPYSDPLVFEGLELSPQFVIERLRPKVTEERWQKIQRITSERTYHISVIAENIYDSGNLNAVMRTAENLGVQSMHIIPSENNKFSQRITKGADKWIDINIWQDRQSCYQALKTSGYQLIATHLSADSIPLNKIDLNRPTVFLLGNEKEGVSDIGLNMADHNMVIPTVGMTQSFNISVAASIILSYCYFERLRLRNDRMGDLTEEQQNILIAEFLSRTVEDSERFLFNE